MTTPQPPYTDPARIADALRVDGYALLRPADVARLAGCSLDELTALAPSWERLELDNYLKDGGRYRRRRHSCCPVQRLDCGTCSLQPIRS